MRFDLNEQQCEFQQAALDFLQVECPVTRALAVHDSTAADLGIWQGLMSLGIGSLMVPEEYGGLGLGLLDLAVVSEAIGRYAAPGPFIEHALATLAIIHAGSEAQKNRWLPLLAQGEILGTVAFAEAKAQWLPEDWTIPDAARLSGVKQHVLHADEAGLIVVGLAGGRLAIVERRAPGLSLEKVPCTDAGKQMFKLTLDECPAERLEGTAAEKVVDAALVLLAADAYGGASHCVDMAVDYAKLREQFGRPIGAFQAIKHQLADMAVSVEPNIGLYWYAAHAFDTQAVDASQAASLSKSHLCEVYPHIARRMIEAHGGIGYTWEFGAHVWLKRALFDQAYFGMPQAHRARVARLASW